MTFFSIRKASSRISLPSISISPTGPIAVQSPVGVSWTVILAVGAGIILSALARIGDHLLGRDISCGQRTNHRGRNAQGDFVHFCLHPDDERLARHKQKVAGALKPGANDLEAGCLNNSTIAHRVFDGIGKTPRNVAGALSSMSNLLGKGRLTSYGAARARKRGALCEIVPLVAGFGTTPRRNECPDGVANQSSNEKNARQHSRCR
jgi:hypothetical protein